MNSRDFCNKYGCNNPEETITKCYRRSSLRLHPDKGGSEEAFKILGNDYNSVQNKSDKCPDVYGDCVPPECSYCPDKDMFNSCIRRGKVISAKGKPMPKRREVEKIDESSWMGYFASFAQDPKVKQQEAERKYEEEMNIWKEANQ